MRRASCAALLLLLVLAPAASAATRRELAGYADRVAAVWASRQAPDGSFRDPESGRPSGGYGNVMIGYALLRAGQRRHDARLIRAGVRGVNTALGEAVSVRGVFDIWAMAAAYNFAREHLAADGSFRAARPRWEQYLRETGPPNIENSAQACIVSPSCFHNHEAVGTAADLELLSTGLTSTVPGSRLANAQTVLNAAVTQVGVTLPGFAQGDAEWTGEGSDLPGLALLSDTGSWPLAYHALSTAAFARSIDLLGTRAPDTARAALRRTAGAGAAFIAPDGTVAYIGRRQEDIWSLAATVAAEEIAINESGAPVREGYLYAAAADRAFERMRTRYPLTSRGLPIVPRSGPDAFFSRGVDGRPMVFNGLSLFLLNIAADAAPTRDLPRTPLPADRDGAFVDHTQAGFAAVRHGDVWFAVHGRAHPPDLRYDFGLVAAKWRAPSGDWVDVVPPRPLKFDASETAGPVVVRGGRRIVPGGPVDVSGDGTVRVGGPLPVHFSPTARGVRISLRARAGDIVRYTAYLPEQGGETFGIRATPGEEPVREKSGYASCCETRVVAERHAVSLRRSGVVTFELVGPQRQPAARSPQPAGNETGDGVPWLLIVLGAFGLVGLGLLGRRRAVLHRRG